MGLINRFFKKKMEKSNHKESFKKEAEILVNVEWSMEHIRSLFGSPEEDGYIFKHRIKENLEKIGLGHLKENEMVKIYLETNIKMIQSGKVRMSEWFNPDVLDAGLKYIMSCENLSRSLNGKDKLTYSQQNHAISNLKEDMDSSHFKSLVIEMFQEQLASIEG